MFQRKPQDCKSLSITESDKEVEAWRHLLVLWVWVDGCVVNEFLRHCSNGGHLHKWSLLGAKAQETGRMSHPQPPTFPTSLSIKPNLLSNLSSRLAKVPMFTFTGAQRPLGIRFHVQVMVILWRDNIMTWEFWFASWKQEWKHGSESDLTVKNSTLSPLELFNLRRCNTVAAQLCLHLCNISTLASTHQPYCQNTWYSCQLRYSMPTYAYTYPPHLALDITQQSLARLSPVTQVLFFKNLLFSASHSRQAFSLGTSLSFLWIFLVYHVWPLGHIGKC